MMPSVASDQTSLPMICGKMSGPLITVVTVDVAESMRTRPIGSHVPGLEMDAQTSDSRRSNLCTHAGQLDLGDGTGGGIQPQRNGVEVGNDPDGTAAHCDRAGFVRNLKDIADHFGTACRHGGRRFRRCRLRGWLAGRLGRRHGGR